LDSTHTKNLFLCFLRSPIVFFWRDLSHYLVSDEVFLIVRVEFGEWHYWIRFAISTAGAIAEVVSGISELMTNSSTATALNKFSKRVSVV
jgi:hypothetical protein